MGFVYVLTGPDHLCALATLVGTSSLPSSSSSSSSSSYHYSTSTWSIFVLGVKWGLGSAVSLFVVGTILIIANNDDNSENEWIIMNDTTSMVLDGFVGIYMLWLGCYGLLKAIKHRSTRGASMQQHQLSGENIELNTSNSNRKTAAPKRSSSNLDKVNEAASDNDNTDDENEEGASFLDTRRASTDIIHQMSAVLNRDGDSMRDSNSDSVKFDPADAADVERRILAAAKSLRQNSNLSSSSRHSPSGSPSSSQLKRRPSSLRSQNSISPNNSTTSPSMMPRSNSLEMDEMEEQFTNTLKASARGALSNSFLSILKDEHRSSSSTPMRASDFTRKHAAPEHSIILERHDEDNSSIITRASRLSGRLLCCCCCFSSACPTLQPGKLAIITGVFHGVSGSASILGVIPLVELKHVTSFAMYTGTVCITSILVMGMFTVCYGTFITLLAGFGTSSSRGGRSSSSSPADIDGYNNRVYVLEGGSAILSIACGIIWLALLSLGKVQEL